VKRSTIAITLILFLAVLALAGDRIAGRTLDAQLAPLLTEELGLPVTLEPIKARLLALKASSAKLVMGNPDDPAVVAENVEVSLSLSALLDGEIRLSTASAKDLMIKVSSWPSDDGPLPEDYLFLDQWLPKTLGFDTGRYVDAEGQAYEIRDASWRREGNGSATVAWFEDRRGGEIAYNATLDSLDALLRLQPLALDLDMVLNGQEETAIAIATKFKPREVSGYDLDAEVKIAGTTATTTASNRNPWSLPSRSDTHIDTVDVDRMRTLIDSYLGKDVKDAGDAPQLALPRLSLPVHLGIVTIDQIRLDDEVGEETSFHFVASEQGLLITSLVSKGPAGVLRGRFDIHSEPGGWKLELDARMTARKENQSIAARYMDVDWLWERGQARLTGQGTSWEELMNSLEGSLDLAGMHRGEDRTPVTITANLDSSPDALTLNHLEVTLGEGQLNGWLRLSREGRRKLALNASAEKLDLDFLFEEKKEDAQPGVAVPEYLGLFPELDLDWKLAIEGLSAPNMSLARAQFTMLREETQGKVQLQALGQDQGELELTLDAILRADAPNDVTVTARMKQLNIPGLFEQDMLFDTRSSGSIEFKASGEDLGQIFQSLEGRAELEVDTRADHDWQRAPGSGEELRFSATAGLVIENNRILGVEFRHLDVDSTEQDITGTLSIVAERTPWLIADLESDNLDIGGLRDLIPDSPEEVDEANALQAIRELGSMQLTVVAKRVVAPRHPLTDVHLRASTAPDSIKLEQLDFSVEDNPLKSSGEVQWEGSEAIFNARASITDFDLDRFLIRDPKRPRIPVSGTLELQSRGDRMAKLLENLTGHIELEASHQQPNPPISERRKLVFNARPLANGMEAKISTFQWGESELAADIRYVGTEPPLIDVTLRGGSVSLHPWEKLLDEPAPKPKETDELGLITSTARASARAVGDILRAPARLFISGDEPEPGDRFFSQDPLPFDVLAGYHLKIGGKLDVIKSKIGEMRGLELETTLEDGKLLVDARAGHINEGSGEVVLKVDSRAQPPTFHLDGWIKGVYGAPPNRGYPRSGSTVLSSFGASEAELAANLNGQIFVEAGEGPYNYQSISLLTTSLSTQVIRTLIPGVERREPHLECAVTLATFVDGKGITPFGYAARTREANLIGRVELDLRKENIRLEFDSRSREGVGLSIGSVFSNTVRVSGPLTNPQVVPRTGGLLARGWAAFMTAGLSVVGESVLKRALASENPCKAIKNDIRKEMCKTDAVLAQSPMVCPDLRASR
jgi:hypothetical protein